MPFGATADSEACAETADCSVRAEVCGLRICGRRSAVIIVNWIRDLTATVRSAITATAELLVIPSVIASDGYHLLCNVCICKCIYNYNICLFTVENSVLFYFVWFYASL